MASRGMRTERLQQFLATAGRSPWCWGIMDCTIMVADWVMAETGIDPAGPYRGAYTTETECRRLIKRCGGLVPIIGQRMDECGFERTQSPGIGDVGIVSAPIGLQDRMPVVGTVGGICCGGHWAMRPMSGMHFEKAPCVTAWKIYDRDA